MSRRTKYINELRNKARKHLHVLARFQEAESIDETTSPETLRSLLSFESNESMYNYFYHSPCANNPNGNPGNTRRPCVLTNCETLEITTYNTILELILSTGLDYKSSSSSFCRLLHRGGCRLKIGGVLYCFTREPVNDIEGVPPCNNNHINIRLAALHAGVPSSFISMVDIASHKGVTYGYHEVEKKLCEHFDLVYYPPQTMMATQVLESLLL